jgi:hypothetical protein
MRFQSSEIDEQFRKKVAGRLDNILADPAGVPNGKAKRIKLSQSRKELFKSALITAAEHASVFARTGPLPNRVRRRGRPPDNAVFIFIDDIVRACKACGLQPGLRYVSGSESLPVRVYVELAPLLWGPVKAPRKVFERWQRHRTTLVRR